MNTRIKFSSIRRKMLKVQYRIAHHEHLMACVFNDMFPLNEEQQESQTQIVLSRIQNGDFETNPKLFFESFQKSKHPDMLTHYSLKDFQKMKCFKVKGFNIGFALKAYEDKGFTELVCLHNNEPTIKGEGEALMESAIKLGAKYLDHFDVPKLSNLYSKLGFKEYKRDKFDSKYFPDDSFEKKYGKADVVYRKYDNNEVQEEAKYRIAHHEHLMESVFN